MRVAVLALVAVFIIGGCGGDDTGPINPVIDAAVDGPPPPPTVSIAATAMRTEGNTGTVMALVAVTLSGRSTAPVTVAYATTAVTAATPADYTELNDTLTFAPGTTSMAIMVPIIGDRLDEDDETLTLTLSDPEGATLGDATSTITITDDDASPTISIAPVTAVEGSATGLGFVVTMSAASGRRVAVDHATVDITAMAGADYTSTPGTLELMPGETTKTITVPITADAMDEPDETLRVQLSMPVDVTIMTAMATGTITDDDPPPVLSVGPTMAAEDAPGGLGFPVSLSGPSGKAIMVTYATSNGNASAADYSSVMAVLMFMPGEVMKTVPVVITDDALDELDETVILTLSLATNATIMMPASATGTIVDDDASPSVSIAPAATLVEGNTGLTTGTVQVTLSMATAVPVTVTYETTDGTTAAADYVDPSGTLLFAPGMTTLMIPIDVVGDTLDEDDETLTLRLTSAQGAAMAGSSSTVAIADDDAPPALSVAPVTAIEGSPRGLVFTVTLSAASSRTVTAAFVVGGGSASAADYAAAMGTVELLPGETTRTVAVALVQDALDEPDEAVQLTLSGAVNATIVAGQATGTINDDDLTPALSIDDAITVEGNGATATASFAVRLSAPSGNAVSVTYGTTAGTAGAGTDYVTAAGVLTIPAGDTAATVDVTVNGDANVEPDEAFTLTLSGPTGATITAPATAIGTILDDDASLPALAIGDVTVPEGNAGTTSLVFDVQLLAPSGAAVTVAFTTVPGTATDQPGVGGVDYIPTAGTLFFPAGQQLRTITVPVVGDVHNEADEIVRVVLSNPTSAILADARADGHITDDDAVPALSTAAVLVGENQPTAVFTVDLSAASGRTVTVDYATADGTATATGHAGTGGEDHAARRGTLTFLPGETTKTVAVAINGDLLDEDDETFSLVLAGAQNASIAAASAEATVTDDDARPTLDVGDRARIEGNAGMVAVAVPVTLSAPSGRTITVDYSTGMAPAPSATAGTDYMPRSATLTFAPGVTTQLVNVTLLPDAVDEASDRFVLDLAGPTNAMIGDAQGLVTIVNDDSPLPGLSIGNAPTVVESVGQATITFTAYLGPGSTAPVTVSYATTIAGSASAGGDFTATSGMLTFMPGQNSRTFTVTVPSDLADEGIETMFVELSGNPATTTMLDAQAASAIVDNDPTPSLSVAPVSVTEGAPGVTATATFTVSMSVASGQPISVAYATRDGAASSASGLGLDDYEGRAGTLLFPAGTMSRMVTVPVLGDRVQEANETFAFDLSSPSNAALATASTTGTINNDDPQPSLAIAPASVLEGPAGVWAPLTFAIALSGPSLVPVTVTFSTANAGAIAGTDFGAVAGSTVTFAPGVVAASRTVFVFGDALTEPSETFTGRLTNATGATIGTGTGTATIESDD